MKISYGPPGHKGVTQIMGLGADEAVVTEAPALKEKVEKYLPGKSHQHVAGLAAGAWVVGLMLGSSRIQNMALGGGAAILLCAHLMKQEESAEVEPLPDLGPLPQSGYMH
jgi:hypothetical protein